MRAPSQGRALVVLFSILAVSFAGVAYAAFRAEVWVVAVAALAVGAWLGSMALRALLR